VGNCIAFDGNNVKIRRATAAESVVLPVLTTATQSPRFTPRRWATGEERKKTEKFGHVSPRHTMHSQKGSDRFRSQLIGLRYRGRAQTMLGNIHVNDLGSVLLRSHRRYSWYQIWDGSTGSVVCIRAGLLVDLRLFHLCFRAFRAAYK